MGFLKRVTVLIYMILALSVGALMILLAIGLVTPGQTSEGLLFVQENINLQMAMIAIGGIFLVTGIISPLRVWRGLHRNRYITFQNPDGEVTLSITAIEDYVRKIAREIPDITNVRSRVAFSRRGINIISDVTISAGANIPQVTEKIQLRVRNEIQSMIGVEEKINMTLHISKILGDAPHKEEEYQGEPRAEEVPFR